MMYPHVSLVQRLSGVIPLLVLLWSSPCRAQQAIAKCWLFSPDVVEATINTELSTVNRMDTITGQLLWSVSARVTWARPPTLDADGAYAVSVVRMPSFQPPLFCKIEERESVVKTEEFVFTGLDFGFLYEFRIFVVNSTILSKSLVVIAKGFGTPDCFQATGDRTFCEHAEVQYAGAPIKPRLDTACLQPNNSLIQAYLSWEPPIQVLGSITAYKMQFTSMDAPAGTLPQVTTAMPDTSTGGRVHSELYDLTPGTTYTVLISAFVIQDGGFNEGLEVELNFQTTGTTTSLTECVYLPPQTTTPGPPPPKLPANKPITPLPGNLNEVNATIIPSSKSSGKMTEQPVKTPVVKKGTNRPPPPTTQPFETTQSTTKAHVGGKPVSSSKTAGIAVAACLVSLGIICAIVMFVLHFMKERSAKKQETRPDTNGAQKGTKTTTSPA